MDRLIALNPSVRKRMPPKQSGAPLFIEKPRHIRRPMVQMPGTNVGPLLQELKLAIALRNDARVEIYIRKIAATPHVSPKLAMRMLEYGVHNGNHIITRALLTKQTIDLATFDGGRLLLHAIAGGQDAVTEMLMRHGADLSDRKDVDDSTLLHVVMRSHKIKNDAKRVELVRELLKRGADVDACDKAGHSVLRDAIVHEHCSNELVEELLDLGARLTVDKSCTDLNDIYAAASHKPALLPRIIEHQVPDEETRNQRAEMAIDYLISGKTADAKTMIERILDLGVQVNTVDPVTEQRVGEREGPLLSKALFHEKNKVIKLLLKHGADPHKKDELGRTPLFQAAAFKQDSSASRRLIKKGADIHTPNDDGRYPIHAACSSESLINIHLLLNLGADLNVVDNEGCTPFSYIQESSICKEAQCLIIKHLALTVAKGEKINANDMSKINQSDWSRLYFDKCLNQLQQMKEKAVWKDVSYFSLLTNDVDKTIELMEDRKFVKSFKRNDKNRTTLFPNYSQMLFHSFEIAEKRKKMLRAEKKKLHPIFGSGLPDSVIEKITYYLCLSCLENLECCQYDYYMSLHASLEDNEADKAKIL